MADSVGVTSSSLRELQQNVQNLLSDEEKYYLSYALKDYKTYKSLEKLVRSLLTCLNTPEKQKIFKDVRHFILPSQQQKFDTIIDSVGISNTSREFKQQNGSFLTNRIKNSEASVKYRVVSLINDKINNIDLGFTICGGKEFGIGIYVSKVVENSPSYIAGLRKNDHLLEVNGIFLQNISLVSAANLFSSLSKLKVVVKEEVNTEIFEQASILNPWNKETKNAMEGVDALNIFNITDEAKVSHMQMIKDQEQNVAESNPQKTDISIRRNSSILNTDEANNERRIKLMVGASDGHCIGLNIRGGCEYGVGIYVSRVDAGSLADQCGLKVGDQILDANGTNFEEILHKDAVDFLKSNRNIILTVKAVGRIPEEKCYFEEYSWVTADGTDISFSNSRKTEYLSSSMPLQQSQDVRHFAADAGDLPCNKSVNIPPGSLVITKEYVDSQTQVNAIPKETDELKDPCLKTSPERILEGNVKGAVNEQESKLRRSPSATSLVSKKSSDSGKSDRGTKSSLNSGDHSDSDRSRDDVNHLLSANKANRSKSFLQKQGDKLKAKFSFRMKKKTAKKNLFDSELFQKSEKTDEWLQYINDKAKERLTVNDYKALMSHIKQYLEKGDIELFTSNVLEILDTTGKSLLLKDVRTIIFPHDIGRFDARVSKREMDNMIALGRDPIESPILDVELSEKPPKKTLVTAVQDKSGKFQLKSKTEAERLEKEREENTKRVSKKYLQQRSILERESTIQRFKSFSNMPRPSREHTQSLSNDPDNLENELDMIPTKEVPADKDELYAKVDKIKYGKKKAIILEEEIPEIPVIITDGDVEPALHAMSDIDEGMESSSQNVLAKVYNRKLSSDGDDDDDYTNLDLLSAEKENKRIVVPIRKDNKSLGISISGGRGSTQQPEIRIERVYPGGAVAEEHVIKAGYQILSIDGESLHEATHNEAVDIIRNCFSNKNKPLMEMTVVK